MYNELESWMWVRELEAQNSNNNYMTFDKFKDALKRYLASLPMFEYAHLLSVITAMRVGGKPERFVDDLYVKRMNPILKEYYDKLAHYRFNRALFNWFTIDPLFTRRNSSLTPAHLKSDLDQLSNHFVREIAEQEIFPNRELVYGQSSYIQTLDLSYYPTERGPYNIVASEFDSNGRLTTPTKRWGGIMRKLETTDFEANNIEYLEFWLMDPFVYDANNTTNIIIMGILLLVICCIYINSSLLIVNPILAIKYGVYDITYMDGEQERSAIIMCSNKYLIEGDELHMYPIGQNMFYCFKK